LTHDGRHSVTNASAIHVANLAEDIVPIGHRSMLGSCCVLDVYREIGYLGNEYTS
jgi:hypothetical protein